MYVVACLGRPALVEDVGPNRGKGTVIGWWDSQLGTFEPFSLSLDPRISPVFLLFAIDIKQELAVEMLSCPDSKGEGSEDRAVVNVNPF
jgi:hypothetical protein